MSNLTANDTRGLMEAYAAVYDQDLREQLEEEKEIKWVALQIIENAAYVLFSQGYNVDDVISYFTEASGEIITEDAIAISEGVLLVESVAVSDEYIAEQFELLYERAGVINFAKGLFGRAATGIDKFITGAKKTAEAQKRLQNIKAIRDAKTAVPPGSAKVTTGAGGNTPTGTARVTTTGGAPVGRNVFQRAATGAKEFIKKIPGAPLVSKLAKSPVGKLASKVAPGAGLALGTMDAASRAKKGDYGGATLSGLGAAASTFLPPGLGTAAALGLAGVQAATDAMGLTGDKSKKGPSAKTAPGAPPSLKAKQDYAKSKGKYYSSSDQKTYANYNDALAARNSRLAKLAPTPPKTPSSTSSTPSSTSSTPQKLKGATPGQLTPGGRKGNEELEGKTFPTAKTKGGTEYEVRTPTRAEMEASRKAGGGEAGVKAAVERSSKLMGGPEGPGKIDPKSVEASLKAANDPKELNKPAPVGSALRAQQDAQAAKKAEEEKKRAAEKAAAGTTQESYDAYDIVLEYLISGGHVESISEAHYVMLEMDSRTIRSIVEADSIAAMRERAAKRRKQRYGDERFGRDDFKSNEQKKKEADARMQAYLDSKAAEKG